MPDMKRAGQMIQSDDADDDQDLTPADGKHPKPSPARRKASLASGGKPSTKSPSADPTELFKSRIIREHRECVEKYGPELAARFGPALGDVALPDESLAAVHAYVQELDRKRLAETEAMQESHALELSNQAAEHKRRFERETSALRNLLESSQDRASLAESELAAVRGRASLTLDDDQG
jgi:uncharacterized coiled-coil protein SlyX